MNLRSALAMVALATTAACTPKPASGPVVVSVIGAETRLRDPARVALRPADAALAPAVAQGLVRFDANGQIQPGLAIRWAISDDGLYYTLRLDRDLATADEAAAALRRVFRRHRDGALKAKLDAVREIVAVTPEVIEIRLSAPRPDLMTLLADPGFALLIDGKGTGPLAIDGKVERLTRLVAPRAEAVADEAPAAAPRPIYLRGERVALAIARYKSGEAATVIGGGFDDFPYTRLATLAPQAVQLDPVTGLFGFTIASKAPFVMLAENRQALAMALDRDAIGEALGVPGWRSTSAILPPGLSDLPQPTRPFWAQALANVRGGQQQARQNAVEQARLIIARWHAQSGGPPPTLRIAMPDGVGSAILFAAVRRQWRAIGVRIVRVRTRDAADLRLIDEVAPSDQADWFIAWFLCGRSPVCATDADIAFTTALASADSAERARLISAAEQRLTGLAPFIPIAQPIRWSLAAPELAGFKANARGIHALPPLVGR